MLLKCFMEAPDEELLSRLFVLISQGDGGPPRLANPNAKSVSLQPHEPIKESRLSLCESP
jgi:hypothetical protein